MNLTVAITGPSRAGKSLFCINFAEYLGARTLCYHEEGPHGRGRGAVSPAEARRLMVEPGRRSNGVVRTFVVNLKRGATSLRLALVDTIALRAVKPLPRMNRAGLVLTLQYVQKADALFYLVDLCDVDPAHLAFIGTAGRLLEKYCCSQAKPFQTILSKKDLLASEAENNLLSWRWHHLAWKSDPVPVSAVSRTGFPELRQLLLSRLPYNG